MFDNSFPTHLRIEHIISDSSTPESELLKLFRAAFGQANSLWPANQRWLMWSGKKLIGHTSVQRRWFVVHKWYCEGWFVGGVCTAPTAQGKGIASQLLRQMHADLAAQELAFAVLNCGASLVPFYSRVGYAQIAERALYLRANATVIDDDPVLAISLKPEFDVATLNCEIFPFGFDF